MNDNPDLKRVRDDFLDSIYDPDRPSHRSDVLMDVLAGFVKVAAAHPEGHDCRLCRQVRRERGEHD